MYSSHTLSKRIPIIFVGLFLALAWTSPAFSASDKRAETEALTTHDAPPDGVPFARNGASAQEIGRLL